MSRTKPEYDLSQVQTVLTFWDHPVTIHCESHTIHEDLKHDFGYFLDSNASGGLQIRCLPLSSKKQWKKLFRFRTSTIFRSDHGFQRVSFFANSYVEYHFKNRRCVIYCDDPAILYESIYLVILSYVGERLDRSGLHRLHGFGFRHGGKGSVLLAPSGGGKSTLALELLKQRETEILSDDTPVLGKKGLMLAFPQRIALKKVSGVESQHLRKFKRVKHGEKTVIGSSFFKNYIAPVAHVNWLVVSRKTKNTKSSIRPAKKLEAIWPLLKWLVIGYETPQIWQLYLRASPLDVVEKCKILIHRIQIAKQLYQTTRVAHFELSSDPKESAQTLSRFLEQA